MSYVREKRPIIDEGVKELILSRLFGENYIKSPTAENTYLGYMDKCVCEIAFYTSFLTIEQLKGGLLVRKFGNYVTNKFFATSGLRCSTDERINFDKNTCTSIMYDNESVYFHFWYRKN